MLAPVHDIFKEFIRYLKIWFRLVVCSFQADISNRINMLVKVVSDIFWYATHLIFFEFTWKKLPSIPDWSIENIRVFVVFLFLTDAFWMMFFAQGTDEFIEKVSRGDLDLLLTKPVNSQWFLSSYKVDSAFFINIVFLTFALIMSLHDAQKLDLKYILLLPFLLLFSLTITYSCRFFFAASSLIFVKAPNLVYLWYQFYRLGTRPDAFYTKYIRIFILIGVPVGYIASIPTRILLKNDPLFWILSLSTVSILAAIFIHYYWKLILKNYSSASS